MRVWSWSGQKSNGKGSVRSAASPGPSLRGTAGASLRGPRRFGLLVLGVLLSRPCRVAAGAPRLLGPPPVPRCRWCAALPSSVLDSLAPGTWNQELELHASCFMRENHCLKFESREQFIPARFEIPFFLHVVSCSMPSCFMLRVACSFAPSCFMLHASCFMLHA